MPRLNNPHDKLFKETFSYPENVKAFLLKVLTPEELDLIDFDTIAFSNNTYISGSLEESHSDLVITCKLKKIEIEIEIAFLLEHKSYKDEYAILQLDEYIIKGYQTQYKNNKELKLIVPILYYHGEEQWNMPDLKDFFAHFPEEFIRYIPHHFTQFISISHLSDEQIEPFESEMLKATMILQKNRNDSNKMAESLFKIINTLDPYIHRNFIQAIFVFSTVTAIRKESVIKSINLLPPNLQKDMVTFGEQLKLEGKAEGKAEGIAEGKAVEKANAQLEKEAIVCNAYKKVNDVNFVSEITLLTSDQVVEILKKYGLM